MRNKINSGVGFSRNKALKNAKGKYIIFLDSDDYLFPKSLLKLENFIEKNKFPDVIVLKHKKTTYPVTNSKLLKDLNSESNLLEIVNTTIYFNHLILQYNITSKFRFYVCTIIEIPCLIEAFLFPTSIMAFDLAIAEGSSST